MHTLTIRVNLARCYGILVIGPEVLKRKQYRVSGQARGTVSTGIFQQNGGCYDDLFLWQS